MCGMVNHSWEGLRLRRLRYALGLSQSQLAKSLSVSGSYLSMLENGNRKPSAHLLTLLCLIYGVSRQWLESGQGEVWLDFAAVDPLKRPAKAQIHYDRNSLKEVIYFVSRANAQAEKPLLSAGQIELILDLYERTKMAKPAQEKKWQNFLSERSG